MGKSMFAVFTMDPTRHYARTGMYPCVWLMEWTALIRLSMWWWQVRQYLDLSFMKLRITAVPGDG